jgi:hypothetical protein
MGFWRVKVFLEDVWDKVTGFFLAVVFFILLVLYVFVALLPIIAPIVFGYAVFAVVSSQIDPVVRGIVFAAYSIVLFLYGGVVGFSGCNEVKEELRISLDMCEKKALSVMDDVRRCWPGGRHGSKRCRSSIESKIYDFMMCMEAVRKKL